MHDALHRVLVSIPTSSQGRDEIIGQGLAASARPSFPKQSESLVSLKRRPVWKQATLMMHVVLTIIFLSFASLVAWAETFAEAPHKYWENEPDDRLVRVMAEVKAGRVSLDSSGEKPFLSSLLRALEIPESSQLLVFSATSLQSERINPRNPRALYFNADTYVGFVPSGRVEVASFDPKLGMVFYIFDRPSSLAAPNFSRSNRCMNCHADAQSRYRPGLVLNSVAVWRDGSTQETYRYEEIGHHVPLSERFGGWHLTGMHRLSKTHANLVGQLTASGFQGEDTPPGKLSDLSRYLRPSSDILPHLVLEHQAGFTNRVIDGIYLARENASDESLEKFSVDLAQYILFRGEAKLPEAGIQGDPDFIRDFQAGEEQAKLAVLRRFELKKRLFASRVSYMLDSSVWRALPEAIRGRVLSHLRAAAEGSPNFATEDRTALREVLALLEQPSASPSAGS